MNMPIKIITALAILFFAFFVKNPPAESKVYKCQDSSGNELYKSTLCTKSNKI
jgi:hypothetical protein